VLVLYEKLIKKGASEVRIHFDSYELAETYFKNASRKQIEYFPKIAFSEIKQIDCHFAIRASENIKALSKIDASLIAKRRMVSQKYFDWLNEKTRWVIVNYPCEAFAQEADMSLSEYEDFVFAGVIGVDWKKLSKEQKKIKKLVDKTKNVRIIAPKTDLIFSIEGRKAVSDYGENNMPGGEVFTSVIENSTNGFITYSFPAIYMGREFHNVRLEFKKGKAVKATADKNEKDLNKILDMDRGARIIGEFGIGNNFQITRFTKDILYDEKIGGTIHLALGKGYKETLSKNKSALHWDMICDLRKKGELWFDNKLVQKKGKWLV
jgi:aminopeptidase